MKLNAIVATDKHYIIGNGDIMPWHISADLKYFKEKTLNNIIIYGRKTFDSLEQKPLPKRENIVISSNKNLAKQFQNNNLHFVNSLSNALILAKKLITENKMQVFIAGGGQIYQQAFDKLDKIYRTLVHININSKEHSIKFPQIDNEVWQLISSTELPKDEDNPIRLTFEIFARKQSG